MSQPLVSCPIVRVPDVVPCDQGELDELVAFLRSDAPVEAARAFARGTLLPDGRLDLCKQSVGAPGCARIAQALRGNSRVKSVLLGTDAIGDEGADCVAHLIENNAHLEVVYLGCNNIGARGARRLAHVLEGNTSVQGLWLKRNPIGDDGLLALGQMLARNTHLQTLDVVNCGFGENAFARFCDSMGRSQTLRRFYAGGNGLGQRSAQSLLDSLGGSTANSQSRLNALLLNTNDLGDVGARALALLMSQKPKLLRELGLGSNALTLRGLSELSEVLGSNTTLEVLDLGRAVSQTVLGARGNDFAGGGAIIAALLRSNGGLRRLNLRGTKLRNSDFALIFEAVLEHPKLCDLKLDVPLNNNVQAHLARNSAAQPLDEETGVALIKSVYRTVRGSPQPGD